MLAITIKWLQPKHMRVKNGGNPLKTVEYKIEREILHIFPSIQNVVIFSMWTFCDQKHGAL